MIQIPSIPIQIEEAAYSEIAEWNHRNTAAPWWRWYWNDRPGWTARWADKKHRLGPNRVVLIAPETNFTASSEAPARHLYFHFVAGPPFHELRGAVYSFALDAALDAGAQAVRSWLASDDALRVALGVPWLCGLALARIEPSPAALDERMRRVTSFLEQHTDLDVTNEELAVLCDMHPNSFIRWFKRAFNTTPRAFVAARKVERACSLLRLTSLGIEQIAEELGFCDRYYFSRVFKRHRGRTPSEFRKQRI